ncbi:hypothetical protein ACH4OY_10175 [Micromonospora rubida]|uniref:AB hydrolase-1 domain-containing protein n=1 Tax=Micromonospora rubida TaxID=2697657 RepID=A0ABW7SH99_9ACTN
MTRRRCTRCARTTGLGWSGLGPGGRRRRPGRRAAVWRDRADDVRVTAIDSGHHMPEEAPEQLATTLAAFLTG